MGLLDFAGVSVLPGAIYKVVIGAQTFSYTAASTNETLSNIVIQLNALIDADATLSSTRLLNTITITAGAATAAIDVQLGKGVTGSASVSNLQRRRAAYRR